MKTILYSFFALCIFGCSHFFGNAENQKTPRETPSLARGNLPEKKIEPIKKRILLLGFKNQTPYQSPKVWAQIQERIEKLFEGLNDYVLVNQSDFWNTRSEWEVINDLDYGELYHRAKAMGIDGILTGTLMEAVESETGEEVGLFRSRQYQISVSMEIELLDVHSEKKVFSRLETAQVDEERTEFLGRAPASYDASRIERAVDKTLDQALTHVPAHLRKIHWVGRIARIELHRFYINSGELSGIRLGQLLKVFGSERPIRDRPSGVMIGVARGDFKGLLKVIDYFGKDGAVAVVHSGAGFREKDRVESYQPPDTL